MEGGLVIYMRDGWRIGEKEPRRWGALDVGFLMGGLGHYGISRKARTSGGGGKQNYRGELQNGCGENECGEKASSQLVEAQG